MDHFTLYLLLACIFGLLMTWGVGANDLANILSTTVGSQAMSIRNVIIVAVIFEFAGAFIGGVEVTDTVRNGIINTALLADTPEVLIYGMLAVLLAGSTWMLVASFWGLPVSITHTIVGSLVGLGAILLGVDAVHWHKVGTIAISWVVSPLVAGGLSYLLFILVQRLILVKEDPFPYAKRYAPIFLFLIGNAFSALAILRGLKHMGFHLSTLVSLAISAGTGALMTFIGMYLISKIEIHSTDNLRMRYKSVEQMFSIMMIFTSCAMVFAHGSNDIAIAVGPMDAIVSIVQTHSIPTEGTPIYPQVTFLACCGVILGLFMYGKNVMMTVGENITLLTPSRAFAATLSAAFTVVLATGTGIPVSTTQSLVGAILGVGLARGIGALNLDVVRNIFMSWIITIPIAAFFAICYFQLFKKIF